MSSPDPNTVHSGGPSLAVQIERMSGERAARCYQCGKCSAGCPMTEETTLRPHDVMRLVALDRRDELLDHESLWLCLACETCAERCPNGCDPARTIDALRELALAAADSAPHPRRSGSRAVRAFHAAFLDQIRLTGRSFELGLVADYKLRTGALWQDVATVPGLVARGKLGLVPHTIAGVAEVRRIFARCEARRDERPGGEEASA
ncbi:MAG: 4Fe-4S dicluster domain-containing protein [Holophagales bacterium]|nr:MAG: 4Fe-4S dicluster domain-containing protein [Holophagales bacterium]